MANKQLFASYRGHQVAAVETTNAAGGSAYTLSARATLAQLVITGAFGHAFYANAEVQLAALLDAARQVEPEYVARVAIFARQRGFMKDTPAVLVAWLTMIDAGLARRAFAQVIDNGRMLRNFVQVLRSGVLGRKSLGTAPKRMVQQWLSARPIERLLDDAVGQSPSLKDILRLVHPRPVEPEREAFYGCLLGKPVELERLPVPVRAFEDFKRALREDPFSAGLALPDVPFPLLTGLPLARAHWVELARRASWQTLRMNLNTYARHGVFDEPGALAAALGDADLDASNEAGDLTRLLADRLRDPAIVRRARVFPFQLLATWRALDSRVPEPLRAALREALQLTLESVPALAGRVIVLPDVSGSMDSSVTGERGGATSRVNCRDVAALLAAAIRQRNPITRIVAFDHRVWPLADASHEDRSADVIALAERLASLGGGGTDASGPLRWLNEQRVQGELVVMISDNQSWIDSRWNGATETLRQWEAFRARNPVARLVCLDIQPYADSQAPSREDILNIGGFSDAVFEVIARFTAGQYPIDGSGTHWIEEIEAIQL